MHLCADLQPCSRSQPEDRNHERSIAVSVRHSQRVSIPVNPSLEALVHRAADRGKV
jgi:hypothetical protein